MCIDRAGGSLKLIAPNPVQKLVPAEYLSGIGHEEMEQFILLVGQRDLLSLRIDLAGSRQEHDPAGAECAGGGAAAARRSKALAFASSTLGLNGLVI